MGRKLAAAVGIGWLCLAAAACGGGSQTIDGGGPPSVEEIAACLTSAGVATESLEVPEAEGVGAQMPDGDDLIIIINIPRISWRNMKYRRC